MGWFWGRGRVLLGAVVVASACVQTPAPRGPTLAPLAEPPPDSQPAILLTLLRSERADGRPRQTVAPDTRRSRDDEESGSVRRVVVKTTPFATPEALARAAIRHAPSRRAREVHENRFLVRARPSVPIVGSSRARNQAREHLRAQRPEIKACLVAALARRPGIAFQTPSALVVEQALRSGPIGYEFDARYEAADTTPTIVDRSGTLGDRTQRCLASALARAPLGEAVVLPVSAFAQPAFSISASRFHQGLARTAAATGWAHYERGEYHEALAFFEDAYWVYHRLEYQVLIGMALERLERPREAAAAFEAYVRARSHAPDADALRRRAERLRGARPSVERFDTAIVRRSLSIPRHVAGGEELWVAGAHAVADVTTVQSR